MERGRIQVKPRVTGGTRAAGRVRGQGLVPGVVYGLRRAATPVAIEEEEILRVLRGHGHILDVALGDEVEPALLREVQRDPLGERILHVDFQRVDLAASVRVEVEVQLTGRAKGVTGGGILEHHMAKLTLEGLPTAIPDVVKIDVTPIELGKGVTVKEILLPAGVKAIGNSDTIVVSVVKPVLEVVAPALAEAAATPAEPELIRPEKKAEGEEAEEKAPGKKKE